MDSPKLIKELFAEQLELKGMNRDKLAASTGIPDRFINAFLEGDERKLPAAPYIRGYLQKIAGVLELDAEELWRMYQRETPPRQSGDADRLPGNRFALQSVSKKVIWIAVAGVLALAYTVTNADRLFGEPNLAVVNPPTDTTTVTTPTVTISGTLGNVKDILTINGEHVIVDTDGKFEKSFPLEAGPNSFAITAKRFLGRTVIVNRQVVYTPESPPIVIPPLPPL